MDDDLKTKEDWERVVVQAEADIKYAEEQLKKFPKSPRYLGIIAGAKTQIDEAKEKLSELRSPSDQLQHKLNRERKLKIKADKLKEGIKQHLVVIAEAEDELEVLREQLHETQEEMQKIASQKILLASVDAAPVAPVDIAQCVTAMQSGLGQMFDDPRLSQEARAKKNEVEAGFLAMRNLASMLSSIQAEYETAKVQAAVPTATAAAEVSSSSDSPSQTAGEAGGEATVPTEEAATPPLTVGSGAPAAVSPVPDGPSEERSATRDRTPPPSKAGKKKTIEKMSDAELAGPRKAKGSNKATA